MTRTTIARWQEWTGAGVQHLVLHEADDAIVANAVVVGMEEETPVGAWFRITCDTAWHVRKVAAGVAGDDRRIALSADGQGNWHDGDGKSLPALAGAIDVDLPLTPFTNTLPVRRLGLRASQSADLRVVYIVLPAFEITISPQRYVCLEPLRRYRYESLDSSFVREVEVDGSGLVVTYPGLFRRLS